MRNLVFGDGEYYHIFNRGTDKRKVFMNKNDYDRFLALLYRANQTEPITLYGDRKNPEFLFPLYGDPLVDICSYALMPNHYHLIIRSRHEKSIPQFMQKLSTAYTMYFNTKYSRSGVLFQGKYKAVHANTDRYLKYLIAYVHLNPLEQVGPETVLEHQFSSSRDFMGVPRAESVIINARALPEYFPKPKDFLAEMEDWISYRAQRDAFKK